MKKKKSLTQTFSYQAIKNGKKVTGEISAKNIIDAKKLVRDKGLTLKSIKKKSNLDLNFNISFDQITVKDITAFIGQLSTMVSANIPILVGLRSIAETTVNTKMKKLISDISNSVEEGSTVSSTLAKYPMHFESIVCSLIEAGEESGKLDIMLKRVFQYRTNKEQIRTKIKKATTYPLAILTIAGAVMGILLIYVIPTFESMFDSMGSELPEFTRIVIDISRAAQANSLLIIGTVVISFMTINYLLKTNKPFQHIIQRSMLKIPLIKDVIVRSIVASMADTLSTTLSAGLSLPDSLTIIAKSSGNIVYYNCLIRIRDRVQNGDPLGACIQESNLFPPLFMQMVSIGEETGELEAMLERSASIYLQEVNDAVESLTKMIEPMFMAFLGVVIGGLVVALYLPVFNMGSGM